MFKYSFLFFSCSFLFLNGCQSYPKKPQEISTFDKRTIVNKTIPEELKPYYVYKPINPHNPQENVPNLLYVLTKGETADEVQIRLEQKGIVAIKDKAGEEILNEK